MEAALRAQQLEEEAMAVLRLHHGDHVKMELSKMA